MTREGSLGAISDFHLERFALGELPPVMARKLEARLSSDPVLHKRLEAVQAHEQLFQMAFPATAMVPRIKATAELPHPISRSQSRLMPGRSLRESLSRRIRLSFAWQTAGAFAILLLAALPIIHHKPPFQPDEAVDSVRLKGMQPELRLHRNTPTGSERLAPGSSASAGDVVQIEFHPGDYPFGAILSVDGKGEVTLHWPKGPDAGTSLSTFREYRLPQAFQLDAAPRFERFHLVLSREPIDLSALVKLAAASADRSEDWLASRLPKSLHVVNFTLRK